MTNPLTIPEYLEQPDAPAAFCFMPRSYYHKQVIKKVGVQKNGLCFLALANGQTLTIFKRDRVVWMVRKTTEVTGEKTCGSFH